MPWTTQDIGDLSGRVAIVTGATSGLGLRTATALAAHGAHVVLAVRDSARGVQAAGAMTGSTAVAALDVADLASVRRFAADFEGPVDILVNNAGVMATPLRRTPQGFELQLATNHLGHFALTGLLLERLTPTARVVTVSSFLHRHGRIDFADLQSRHRYRRRKAYAQSKLANLLFAFELQRRLTAARSDVESLAAHPGYAATNLQTRGPRMAGNHVVAAGAALLNRIVAQPAEAGALPSLRAATDRSLPGGTFV